MTKLQWNGQAKQDDYKIDCKQRPQRDNESGNTWLLLDSGMVPLSELTWLERESF